VSRTAENTTLLYLCVTIEVGHIALTLRLFDSLSEYHRYYLPMCLLVTFFCDSILAAIILQPLRFWHELRVM
jgi:hypothetical protein